MVVLAAQLDRGIHAGFHRGRRLRKNIGSGFVTTPNIDRLSENRVMAPNIGFAHFLCNVINNFRQVFCGVRKFVAFGAQ